MSGTLFTIIAVVIMVFVAFILRWQRDFVIVRICPREIRFLNSVEERRRVHDRGVSAFWRHRSTWKSLLVFIFALGIPSAFACGGLLTIAENRTGQWSATVLKLAAIMCALLPGLLLIPLMHLRYRKWMRVFLRDYLNDRGIPICESCGYDLRGQAKPRCPECGVEFDEKRGNKRCQEE